jgi:hypothetical protein
MRAHKLGRSFGGKFFEQLGKFVKLGADWL